MDPKDVKSKIQSVQEVVRCTLSKADVSLVLQHFDYNVESTIEAFLEGQSKDIIHQWSKNKNKKTNTKKRNKESVLKDLTAENSTSHPATQIPTSDLTLIDDDLSLNGWSTSNSPTLDDVTYPSSSSSITSSSSAASSSSSLASSCPSSDVQSLSSDPGVAPESISSLATEDSGCDTTSGSKIHRGNGCSSDADRRKQKSKSKDLLKGLTEDLANSATRIAVEQCFEVLQTRLDERRLELIQRINKIECRSNCLTEFTCDLQQLIKAIDNFGQVIPSLSLLTSMMDKNNDPNKSRTALENLEASADLEESLDDFECETEADESNSIKSGLQLDISSQSTSPIYSQLSSPAEETAELEMNSEAISSKSQTKLQKKKSRTKDRRTGKTTVKVSSSLEVGGVNLDDLIQKPSTEAAVKQQSVADKMQENGNIAYKDYVFQQSDSLTKYEMILKEKKKNQVA